MNKKKPKKEKKKTSENTLSCTPLSILKRKKLKKIH